MQAEYSPVRTVGLGKRGSDAPRKTSVLERKSTFEAKEVRILTYLEHFCVVFSLYSNVYSQMKQPPPRTLSLAEGNPIVGKRVKEGLVSQIASKFQRQETSSTSTNAAPAAATKRPERISLDSPSPTTSPSRRFSSVSAAEARKEEERARRPVSRTESHHTRFNNARALFEKLGSAEELDAPATPPATASASSGRGRGTSPTARAASVGRAPEENGQKDLASSKAAANSTTAAGSSYFRSRSSSPFSGSPKGDSSQRPSRTSVSSTSPGKVVNGHETEISAALTEEAPSPAPKTSAQNGLSGTTGLVKSRRLSFQQKQQATEENAASAPAVASSSKFASANGDSSKVGRQPRNWFPSGASKPQESVESARRASVKNDSTPNLVASPSEAVPAGSFATSESRPGETESLDLPAGDRRPLGGMGASSDSIEEYLKNWKSSDEGDREQQPGPER